MAREEAVLPGRTAGVGRCAHCVKEPDVSPGGEGKLLESFKQGGGRIRRRFKESSPVATRKVDLMTRDKKINSEAVGLVPASY